MIESAVSDRRRTFTTLLKSGALDVPEIQYVHNVN
jgi:hypothetical protein